MDLTSDKIQYFSVEDIKKNPELITQLLLKTQDISVILEKRGNKVLFAYLNTYNKETIRILEESKNEYKKIKKKGYTHEKAFKDFTEAREEINKYL